MRLPRGRARFGGPPARPGETKAGSRRFEERASAEGIGARLAFEEGVMTNEARAGAGPVADGPFAPVPITLTINGERKSLSVEPWVTLLDLLREREDLTGTKKGCDHGQCGACTVLVDGRRINACLALAVSRDGAEIVTIEGLGCIERPHPLQQAFIERDAFQCGYCTPGQICSAQGLINEGRARSRDEVREAMSGNLCRCGAYTNIADAVMDVLGGEGAR
jgi:xanthine dehydrogenase YagT iron-sulfur-binding subunit